MAVMMLVVVGVGGRGGGAPEFCHPLPGLAHLARLIATFFPGSPPVTSEIVVGAARRS